MQVDKATCNVLKNENIIYFNAQPKMKCIKRETSEGKRGFTSFMKDGVIMVEYTLSMITYKYML